MEKDHLEILLEDIRSKFDLVLEGHDALRQRMNRLAEESKERDDHLLFEIRTVNGRVDRVDSRLGRVEQKVDNLEVKVEKLEQKVDNLGQKVDRLDQKLDGVARDLADHRRDTEAHGGVYRVKEG